MRIRFACPQCSNAVQLDMTSSQSLRCDACHLKWLVPSDAIDGNHVQRCAVCSGKELFLRKDFPQRLGLFIVMVGLSLSCVTWYFHEVFWTFAVLFASALVDVALYATVGNVLTCYRCHAEYRNAADTDYAAFDLEVHERFRQQEARLKEHTNEPESGDNRGRPARFARR